MQMRIGPAVAWREYDLPAGRIRARMDGALMRATGIPYARAARWQKPQALADIDMTATDRARACPQLPIPRLDAALPGAFGGIAFSENCLDLSVTAPAEARNLPVIVWLHGGSYELGAADMPVFDPTHLASEGQVIFVSISYRLGLFGWLSGAGRPANLGALDVIAALEWVQRNIAGFGGDPGRVTLYGQSSGGDLIARLMAMSGAVDLFQRAIIVSAPLNLPLKAGRMRRVMRRAAGDLPADASLALLLAGQQSVRRAVRRFGLAGQMPFGPEFGADPFPAEEDLHSAQASSAPQIEVMIGHTRDEAALFLPPGQGLAARLSDPLRRQAVNMLSTRLYARPAADFAARHRAAGGRAARFVIDWGQGAFGASHLADLPLIFPGAAWLGTPLLPPQMTLPDLIAAGAPLRALWASFAASGDVGDPIPGVIRFAEKG